MTQADESGAQAPDSSIKLADDVSEDRATGRLAVYDTKLLRYLTGALERGDEPELPDGVAVSKSGRYQLRRV